MKTILINVGRLATALPPAMAALALLAPALHAQGDAAAEPGNRALEFEIYAVINYYHFRWDTDTNRRDAMDLERLVIEPEYRVSDRLEFEAEIEFEHGGTGATLEFDPIEEYGEFEQEVEAGGEIIVEKLQATYSLSPALRVRMGRMYVPVGMITARSEPDDYFTNTRNESEAALIPNTWHETGIGLLGAAGPGRRLRYQACLVTGLDATGFSSAGWVAPGHQGRFEFVNAENLALVGRIDWAFGDESLVGASAYYGNSAGNRPKPDLRVPAHVTIFDAHAWITAGPVVVRALVLYGHLENADLVSAANRNLPNALDVKRTPVATEALAWFIEAGYDVLHHRATTPLYLYARYDWYDTMHRVRGTVFDNPRWEREVVTAGVNWTLDPHLLVKASYASRTLGLPTANRETTVMLGIAGVF